MDADGAVVLQEALPGPEHAWLDGDGGRHLPELVISLVQRSAPARPVPQLRPAAGGVPRHERLRPPGSDWLFAKLYGPPSAQDELIAGPVRTLGELATAAGLARHWFYVRYADPGPHLRLRFSGDPDTLLGELLPQLCDWARELLDDGRCDRLGFDTYEREIERYGGTAAMAVVEEIFAIDSAAAVELVGLRHHGRIGLDQTELAVLSMDVLLDSLALGEAERLALYRRAVLSRHESGTEYRKRRRELRALLSTGAPGDRDPGGAVAGVLGARTAALREPVRRITDLGAGGHLGRAWPEICESLLHMHCNRVLGRGAPAEAHVLGLALRTREGLDRAPRPR